jgi:hypothetical protein
MCLDSDIPQLAKQIAAGRDAREGKRPGRQFS